MKKVFALLALSVSLFGQAYRVDPAPVTTTSGSSASGSFPALYAVAGASISICTDTACASPATTYTTAAGSTPCPINAPVTLPGSSVCTGFAGAQGQFGFWLSSGNYYYTVTPLGAATAGPYPLSVPASAANWITLANKPLFDVKAYGATGNGTTDDLTSIQSAITAACVVSGAVLFSPGTYLINSGTISASCAGLELASFGTATINQSTGSANMLSITASNVIVLNLTFTGVGKTGGFAIYTNNVSTTNFDNVTITNVPNGYDINGNGTSVTRWNNGYISGLAASTGVGIRLGNVGNPIDNYIDHLIVNGNGALADIQVHSTGLLVVSNSDLLLSNYPLQVIPGTAGQVAIIYATNTFFDTGAIYPLYTNATGGGVADIGRFTNDWFATGGTSGASLNGNTLDYTFDSCQFLNNGVDGIDINGVSTVTVSNSTFTNNGTTAPGSFEDIYVKGGSSHITLTGNHFLAGVVAAPNFNLLIDTGTVNNLIVTGNDFDNFNSGPIQDLSTTGTSTFRVFAGNVNPTQPTIVAAATISLSALADQYYVSGNTAAITAMSPVWLGRVVKLLFTAAAPAGVSTGGAASVNFTTSHSATQYQILTCTYYGAGSGINWACQ